MPHIFISYSKKDTRQLAFALADALANLPDITVWVDRSLKAGLSWEASIQREILRCDYVVVLYSPDINRHLTGDEPESYVLNEIAYAQTKKKTIIPVMVQPTDPPLSLIRMQHIDYTLPGLTLADLVDSLCAEINVQPTRFIASAAPTRSKVYDILPPPFEWIDIPAGKVTLEAGDASLNISAFTIAKYPITNLQFAKFIEAGGYQTREYWTTEGWNQREHWVWMMPEFWRNSKWNGDNYPVVGVSWFEALAFCQWLSSETGEVITLPTEQQWQRAAQSDDGRTYPWGNEWDKMRCNTKEAGIGQTTPVTHYPSGASPYGLLDMSGNVWEWCLTAYSSDSTKDESNDLNVLSGGSWDDDQNDATLKHVFINFPDVRFSSYGFRIVRLPSPA